MSDVDQEVLNELAKEGDKNNFRLEDGGIALNDPVVQEAQRELAFEFVKTIGKTLLTGNSIMRLAIPLKKGVQEARSQVQVLAEHLYCFDPLLKASQVQGQERINECISYYFSTLIQVAIRQNKPFNPLMAETFQDKFSGVTGGEQYNIYTLCEHIKNHPPTSLYSIRVTKGDKLIFKINGCATLEASVFMNHVDVVRRGLNVVTFSEGQPRQFIFQIPPLRAFGLFYGQRWGYYMDKVQLGFNYKGEVKYTVKMMLRDEQTKYCEETVDLVLGRNGWFSSAKHDRVKGSYRDKELEGSWMNEIKFGSLTVYKFGEQTLIAREPRTPEDVKRVTDSLFSDARNREDIQLFEAGDVKQANVVKLVLEEKQRSARKLRGCE